MNDSNSTVLDEVSAPRFPSFIALRAKHSELLQREPETEDAKQRCLQEAEDFIKQVQATGTILSSEDERRLAQNILNYWVSALYREDQVARSVALADYDPKLTADVGDVVCPYPGVRPFTEDDSPFFFGRQRQIDYMLGRLSEDRLLVIVGPSGAGKTSLVQAGLLPALKKEPPNNVEHFFLPPMSPGTQPLNSLAMMIKEAHPSIADNPNWVEQQVKGFQQDQHHLLKLIEQITDKPVVIFVDQGEDLYERNMPMWLRPFENILDLDNSKKTIEPFLDNLMRVIQSSNRKHIVIVTRRVGDFEKHIKRLPSRVKEVFEPARVLLPALYASELSDAIQKPAELLGVTFQELHHLDDSGHASTTHQTTVQALVREISSEPVGLPLLQFTLPRLWEKRVQSYIPEEAFLQIGSCQTALANAAEQFYVSLSHSDRSDCRTLLKQLVNLDRELKAHIQPVRRSALYPSLRNPARFDELIARMDQQQLVRITKGATAGDDLVELVHESLLRNWSRMSKWIELKVWLRQQTRNIKVLGLGLLIAAIALVALYFIGRRDQKNKAEDLARLSAKQATYDRFDLALLLGRQAYALRPNVVTRSNLVRLLHALQSTSRPKSFLYKQDFEVDDIVFSAPTGVDSDKLAAVDNNGNIVIWDLMTREVVKTFASANIATYPLAFSPDGRFLATASLEEGVPLILWDLNSPDGQRRNLTYENPAGITTVAFHPKDSYVVAADADGAVIRWNDGEIKGAKLYEHVKRVTTIAFSSDGALMATGSEDGKAIVSSQTVKNGRRKIFSAGGEVSTASPMPRSETIFSLDFRDTDNLLAAGGEDEVFIWDVDTGEEVTKFNTGPSRGGVLASFSGDGELLTAFSFGGTLVSWDLASEQTVGKQFYNPAATYSAAFSNHGRMLALPSDDGVVLWEVSDQGMLRSGSMVPVSNTVHSLAFSPNRENQILASLGHDGSLTVWHPGTKNEAVGSQIQSNISRFAFNGDGSIIALAFHDGTISLRDIKDYQEIKTLDVATRKVVARADLPGESEQPVDAELEDDTLSIARLVAAGRNSPWLAALVVKTSGETNETKVLLWNTTEASAAEVTSGSDTVTALAISPDGRTLAWGSFDTQTERSNVVVSVAGKQEILSCSENENGGCTDKVSSLAFSEKGKLAAGLENGQIILWDSASRKRIDDNPMQGAAGVVTDLAFGLDEAVLAAVTNKNLAHPPPGTITLWDLETREPIGNLLRGHGGNVSSIAFSADGKTLASASDADGDNIILWDLDVEHADSRFCGIVDCDQERDEIAAHINDTTWPQLVYQTVIAWYERLSQTRLFRRFNRTAHL